MKNVKLNPLVMVCAFFVVFLFGFFLGRLNDSHTVKLTDASKIQTTATQAHNNLNSDRFIDGKININTAEAEDLMLLPGIGEILARRIIDYRTKNGLFASVDDLMNVKGIGESSLEKISAYITVGG